MRLFFLLFFILGGVLPSFANLTMTKSQGDSAYAEKNYTEAARIYTELVRREPSATLYYNWGNAEYRLKNYANAVLAYERALHLDPSFESAQFNLEILRTRLTDRFAAPPKMFFVSATQKVIANSSVSTWTKYSFVALILVFLFLVFYVLCRRVWLRKFGFFGALTCCVAFLVFCGFAVIQRRAFFNNSRAVVIVNEAKTFTSPSESSQFVRVLHEGTTIDMIEKTSNGWVRIELPDGGIVWLKQAQIERVVQS